MTMSSEDATPIKPTTHEDANIAFATQLGQLMTSRAGSKCVGNMFMTFAETSHLLNRALDSISALNSIMQDEGVGVEKAADMCFGTVDHQHPRSKLIRLLSLTTEYGPELEAWYNNRIKALESEAK
jgi:hypothetical protein